MLVWLVITVLFVILMITRDRMGAFERRLRALEQRIPRPAAAVAAQPPAAPVPPQGPMLRSLGWAWGFLLGGNTMVRVGIVVLLVGIVLLLRWVAENALLPIELRLAAAAAGAAALVVIGFRERVRRPGFARTLQGGLELTGTSAPLPYLPILNPVDVALLLCFAAVLLWWRAVRSAAEPAVQLPHGLLGWVPALVAAFAFAAWNGMLARSVHQYSGVPFDATALFRSVPLQMAFSLSWTVIALAAMLVSQRSALRAPWLAGAALLAVVVVKLFVLDLSRLSTPAKIVTFLCVGALLLVLGYVSPVPPARRAGAREGEPPFGAAAPGLPGERTQ